MIRTSSWLPVLGAPPTPEFSSPFAGHGVHILRPTSNLQVTKQFTSYKQVEWTVSDDAVCHAQVLGEELDPAAVLRGEVTPMFFGSAMTNFGVEPFLNHFIDFAARPGEHATKTGASIAATAPQFTGLVFKLQVRG